MAFINTVGLNTLWKTTKNVAKHYEYMVVDPIYVSKLERGLAGGKKGQKIVKSTSECFEDAFKLTAARANGRNIFKRVWDSLKGIGSEYKAMDMKKIAASHLAKEGKELKFFGKVGKFLGPIGKRMPLIGNLMALGMAIPTIASAFSNGGVGAGLKETGKEAFKLGAFTIGAAVGTALLPPLGGLIGGFVGQWVADKIVGKSFTEKKEDAVATETERMTAKGLRKQVELPNQTSKAQYQQNPQAFEGQYAQQQPAYAQQPAFAQAQYTNQVMPNQFGQNVYAQGASQTGASSFDMNGDFLAQTSFGPSNNNMYAFNRQQQY